MKGEKMENKFTPGACFEDALSKHYHHVFDESFTFEVTVNSHKLKDLAARDPKWFREEYSDQTHMLNDFLYDCFDGFEMKSIDELKSLILDAYPELNDCELAIHFYSDAEDGLNFEFGSMTDGKHITDTAVGSFSVTCEPCIYYFHVHSDTFKDCVRSPYRKYKD
jgi:hypothetical protein